MKLLATIRPEDVDLTAPPVDYSSFKIRPAGRVILFDGGMVALLYSNKHGYYMLPGGGIDAGEDLATGIARELQEELGCKAVIGQEVGSTELYMDRWRQKQVDTCFIARKANGSGRAAQTDFEKAEGHEIVWAMNLSEAIRLVEDAMPQNRDSKLVRARDLVFLKAAKDLLV